MESQNQKTEKKNVLIITGLSMDKRESNRINSQMAKDRDLKRFLSRWGLFRVTIMNHSVWKYIVYLLLSVGVYVVTQIFVSALVTRSSDIKILLNDFWTNRMYLIYGLVVSVLLYVYNLIKDYRNQRLFKMPKVKCWQYKQFKKNYKQPLDIWNLFVSNMSDAQTAIPFLNEQNNHSNTSLFYTGVPYYDVEFIDSIYIDFGYKKNENDSKELRKNLKALYGEAIAIKKGLFKELRVNYINDFSKESGNSAIDVDDNNKKTEIQKDEYERDPDNLFSSYVFGIRFLSRFFSKITRDEKSKLHEIDRDNGRTRMHVSMCLSNDINLNMNNNTKEEKRAALKEVLMQLVDLSTSDKFHWNFSNETAANQIRIQVGMTEIGTKSYDYNIFRWIWYRMRKFPKEIYVPQKKVVRIPFKRPIAIPKWTKGDINERIGNFLPPQAENKLKDTNIFYVGGAEHNLALLCALRQYRNEHRNVDIKDRIGILENEYDFHNEENKNIEERPLLISTEKLVQSFYIRGKHEKPEEDKFASKFNYSYAGELIRFSLKDRMSKLFDETKQEPVNLYSFFGYSAPMTKIISAFIAKYQAFYINDLFNDKEQLGRIILLLFNDSISQEDLEAALQKEDADKKKIMKLYRKIYNFPAVKSTWDVCDFINTGDKLIQSEDDKTDYKRSLKAGEGGKKIILFNSLQKMDLGPLEEAVKESPIGHNLYFEEQEKRAVTGERDERS